MIKTIVRHEEGAENIMVGFPGEYEISEESSYYFAFLTETELTSAQNQHLDTNPNVLQYFRMVV